MEPIGGEEIPLILPTRHDTSFLGNVGHFETVADNSERVSFISNGLLAFAESDSCFANLGIECGLRVRNALHFSTTSDGIQRLEKEYQARRDAGLDVAALKGAALFRQMGTSGFGLLTRGNASVDPYKATLGLARAAATQVD